MRKFITLLTFVALIVPLVSVAHHSFGLYSTDVSELEGVLVDVAWRNPHVQLTFDSTGENGQEVRWTLEGPALYVLERRGISRDFFQVGEQLRIAGRANQTGKPQLWMHSILIPDGRELMMIGGIEPNWTTNIVGSDGVLEVEDAESQNLGIFRVWGQPALHPIDYGSDLPYLAHHCRPALNGLSDCMDMANDARQWACQGLWRRRIPLSSPIKDRLFDYRDFRTTQTSIARFI